MPRFVIDTDPGVDDAQAIMMAFAHPDTQVEALTTVAGNVPLSRTTPNACTILDVLGHDVPVYAGCDRALVRQVPDAAYVHGEDGLGNTDYPASKREVSDEHAVNALVRMANDAPGELTLVTLGPLTNVAMAVRLDPTLPEKYDKLVVMGGAIRATGNTPNVSTEFNVYADPEAAAIVLDAWPRLTLVSWEATMDHPLTYEQLDKLTAYDTPRAEFFKRISETTVKYIREILGSEMLFAADPLAMAVALEPDIVQEAETHDVQVELAGEHTRGQTTVDWFDRTDNDSNVEVVLKVDKERFWELMAAAVR